MKSGGQREAGDRGGEPNGWRSWWRSRIRDARAALRASGPWILDARARFLRGLRAVLIGCPPRREGRAAPGPSPAAGARAEGASGPPWRLALEIVGGLAGITVLVAFVGGAILWARFNGLTLPEDQAVAVLPRSVLVTVGAGAIAPALILAAVIAVLVGFTRPLDETGQPRCHLAWILRLLVVGEFLLLLTLRGLDLVPYVLAGTAAALIGAVLVWGAAVRLEGYRVVGWTLFAMVAVVAGINQYVRTLATPKMEPAAVLLKEKASEGGEAQGIAGFYVGQSSDRLYLAPLSTGGRAALGEDVGGLLEIPREEIERLAIRDLAPLGPAASGRAEAVALLAELREREERAENPAAAAEVPVVRTSNPQETFAPLLHLHVDDGYRPMSAEFFLEHSQLRWAAPCSEVDDFVALGAAAPVPEDVDPPPPRLDYARLGRRSSNPYSHGPGCEADVPSFEANEHTRPYDRDERPAGLPASEGFYLDLSGKSIVDPRIHINRTGLRATFTGPPIYFQEQRLVLPNGSRRLRITYWFLYGNSVPPGPGLLRERIAHEGDWERVSVLLTPLGENPSDAVRFQPISVRFHIHDRHVDVPWSEVELVGEDPTMTEAEARDANVDATHPVAYSAGGSHATYPVTGRHESVLNAGGRDIYTARDDTLACADCPQWATWHGPTELVNAYAQEWYGFGGAWGLAGDNAGFTGPLGPSKWKLDGAETEATVEGELQLEP